MYIFARISTSPEHLLLLYYSFSLDTTQTSPSLLHIALFPDYHSLTNYLFRHGHIFLEGVKWRLFPYDDAPDSSPRTGTYEGYRGMYHLV